MIDIKVLIMLVGSFIVFGISKILNGFFEIPNRISPIPFGVCQIPNRILGIPNGILGIPNGILEIPNRILAILNGILEIPNGIEKILFSISRILNGFLGKKTRNCKINFSLKDCCINFQHHLPVEYNDISLLQNSNFPST